MLGPIDVELKSAELKLMPTDVSVGADADRPLSKHACRFVRMRGILSCCCVDRTEVTVWACCFAQQSLLSLGVICQKRE